MTTINNNTYTFSVKKDTYVLVNKLLVPLAYKLHLIEKEGRVDTIKDEGSLLASNHADYSDKVFTLLNDGRYKLEIINADDVYFESWIKLRNELIPLLKKALCCSCGCKSSCESCLTKEAKDCIRNQSLLNFMTTYQYLVKPFSVETWLDQNEPLFNFYQSSYFLSKEHTLELLGKQIFNCSLYGSPTTNGELFKFNLAIAYLGLYFYAKADTLVGDIDYLNTVYDFIALSKCIAKLGINIAELETIATKTNSLVYYWQLTNPIDNITDVDPIFDMDYLVGKPFADYSVFEQGKIINYTNIGRIAFAVTSTTGVDFELKDSLGNDITDDFDSVYYPTNSILLLVSKLVQSYSNIYFRFKTL
jgi:hypothetical protein